MTRRPEGLERQHSPQRWTLLLLSTITAFVLVGFPTTGMSAMFSEIAASLDLDLVELGWIWGVSSAMGIVTALIGGIALDHYGTRRTLVLLCLATGLSGALRGFAFDFWSLFAFSFLHGMFWPVMPMTFAKLNREWFASRQLGFAVGVMSTGFASGLMLGSRFCATVLSPLLGGWRATLLVLGAGGIILALLWLVAHPPSPPSARRRLSARRIARDLRVIARFREFWVIALSVLAVVGLFRGLLGYVPTYLRELGWSAVDADSAITVYFLVSLISVAPITRLSDRLGDRKRVMAVGSLLMSAGVALMAFVGADFWGVMLAMVLSGCCIDAFLALKSASLTEIEGLELGLAGSALGFGNVLQNIGSTFIPPLGNMVSPFGLNLPFLFWAGWGVAAAFALLSYRRGRPAASRLARGSVIAGASHRNPGPKSLPDRR